MLIKEKTRNEIEEKFKWKLSDLFATDELWQKEYDEIIALLDEFNAYKGRLNNCEILLKVLRLRDSVDERASRVYVYAGMKLHEDSNISFYQGLSDKADSLVTKLSQATAFIDPEILSIDEVILKGYLKENKEFAMYAHYIDDLTRLREHVLSPELEELLAATGEMAQAPDNIYSMLSNADMKFAVIKDEDGNDVSLTHGRFISFLESTNRDVRQSAYNALYDEYIKQKNTIATIYNASVKKDIFYAKTRKYASSLESALSARNIPVEVVENLISAVSDALPQMHRYMRLRKKLLGLSELSMYDLYTPIVKNADSKVLYDSAKSTVLTSLKPMGSEYMRIVEDGYNNGWIDVYENAGKRSGAYSWGAYGCHPYVLLNYDNKLNDMFTLAHEMGHAMHSYYSWNTQPYIYSGHTIFVAEVASTVNEALLMDHLLKTVTDKAQHKYLLNYFLEQFRGTVFRQTMFAEFEMKTHKMAENGDVLTVDSLCETYKGLLEKYFGNEVLIDDKIIMEWSRIPHFYSAFYVFQYATGFSAAVALSKKILEQGEPAASKYINFLKSGTSDYSIPLLKAAGVDMATKEPVTTALSVFAKLLDEIEQFN